MYDTVKIRKYNRKRGIKSNIPVNKRNRKKKKRGRPIKVDKEEFKKKSIVERFFRDNKYIISSISVSTLLLLTLLIINKNGI